MPNKRSVEVFSAGCDLCEDALKLVREVACDSCEVIVRDVRTLDVAGRAKALGVRSVPAVVVDGRLADCCAGRGIDEDALRNAGVGRAL
jgi:glutaredoxin 3